MDERKECAAALADSSLVIWEAGRRLLSGAPAADVADSIELQAVALGELAKRVRAARAGAGPGPTGARA